MKPTQIACQCTSQLLGFQPPCVLLGTVGKTVKVLTSGPRRAVRSRLGGPTRKAPALLCWVTWPGYPTSLNTSLLFYKTESGPPQVCDANTCQAPGIWWVTRNACHCFEAEALPGWGEQGPGSRRPWSSETRGSRRQCPLLPPQIAVTFAIVLGVIIYRISTAAALAMNSSPSVRSNIRVTVTATAVIINLVVIILLDEVYGCIARWLTKIGECPGRALEPGGRTSPALGPWAGHSAPLTAQ